MNTFTTTTTTFIIIQCLLVCQWMTSINGFTIHSPRSTITVIINTNNKQTNKILFSKLYSSNSNNEQGGSQGEVGYTPPEQSQALQTKRKPPQPKVGDIVRFYDLDGGQIDGQELIGKISYISQSNSKWIADITEMEDVGDGYYAEYPSRKRRKNRVYDIAELAPLSASYVRSEDAFKIPMDRMGRPSPMWEGYNLVDYEGPMKIPVNEQVVQQDLELYSQLKLSLLKDAAIAGLIGTTLVDLTRGLEIAFVYFLGALSGVGYLFFLGIKTDTVGSSDAKLGSNVSNLRFALPLLVLVGVSFQNLSTSGGDASSFDMFRSVTPEQFAAAMLGFLTFRIPLFISQLGPLIGESVGLVLPGSAGIAIKMAQDAKSGKGSKNRSGAGLLGGEELTTILLISGPAGTGKAQLVQRLIEESGGKLVAPKFVDAVDEPILYEQLVSKDEILQMDESNRYALTKEGILSAARKPNTGENVDQVVVVDADVNLSKKLVNLGGTRIVGVWVGLDELEKFESNLSDQLDAGMIPIPETETKESILRGKIREIVKDIEYGVVSGIFEFTILNDDFENSLVQLKNAANYCFEE